MVQVMRDDGSLLPSIPQKHVSRPYHEGIGQDVMRSAWAIPGQDHMQTRIPTIPIRRGALPAPDPRILAAITDIGQRYADHPGLRKAGLSVTDWLTIYRANIEIESGYDPQARSPAGAIGLGQLMPGTARFLGVDPHDWHENLDGSARYLAMMLAEFGDVRLALAAYNAGPEAIHRHSGIPPFPETQNHVRRVLDVFHRLERVTP